MKGLEASDWVAIGIAVASLLVSFWVAFIQRRDNRDKELLSQLILTLERAHAALRPSPEAPPSRDRLAWLTAARHLRSYYELKSNLKTSLCKRLCEEHEEFWRHQFYVLADAIDSPNFFHSVGTDKVQQENIDPTSAAVVLAFSDWPNDKEDPLDQVSLETLVVERNLLSARVRHFRSYIETQFPETYRKLGK